MLSLECFDLLEFGGPQQKERSRDHRAQRCRRRQGECRQAEAAEAILISCGGLRTLGVAKPLEASHGIPVVSSATAAFWAAMRLVGDSGHLDGYGRLFEQSRQPVH